MSRIPFYENERVAIERYQKAKNTLQKHYPEYAEDLITIADAVARIYDNRDYSPRELWSAVR